MSIISSSIDDTIQQFIGPELSDEVHRAAFENLVTNVEDSNNATSLTIQDLIERLEKHLTSSDDKVRNRATLLLADLLHNKTSVVFGPSVIHLFVVFFCHRLNDYPSIVPSLHALLALVKYHDAEFDAKYYDITDIFQTIFRDVNVPSLAQSIRSKAFELFHAMMVSEAIVASMVTAKQASEVLDGLVNTIEGEKDPRCLVTALQLLTLTMKIGTISDTMATSPGSDELVEKLFNYTACYFPITFAPPADDPFGITSEMLILALEECLCGHTALHRHVVSFLVDHLTDEMNQGKVQSIRCLLRLCRAHGPARLFRGIYPDTGGSLLSAIGDRLYSCVTEAEGDGSGSQVDPTVSKYALWGISAICAEIGRDISGEYLSDWRVFGEPLLQKSSQALTGNTDGLQSRSAAAVFLAIASSSLMCSNAAITRLLPLLLNKASDISASIASRIAKVAKQYSNELQAFEQAQASHQQHQQQHQEQDAVAAVHMVVTDTNHGPPLTSFSLQIVAQLIRSVGLSTASTSISHSSLEGKSALYTLDTSLPTHGHTHAHTAGGSEEEVEWSGSSSVDLTSLREFNPLNKYAEEIFVVLASMLLLRPRRGEDDDATKTTGGAAGAAASNVIAASDGDVDVKEEDVNHDHVSLYPDAISLESLAEQHGSQGGDKNNKISFSTPPTVKVSVDVEQAIAHSVDCMRELLLRIEPASIPEEALNRYISTATDIAIHGASALVTGSAKKIAINTTTTTTPTINNKIKTQKHRRSGGGGPDLLRPSVLKLLSALTHRPAYEKLLGSQCVGALVRHSTSSTDGGDGGYDDDSSLEQRSHVFDTMASLIRQGPSGEVMSACLPLLLHAATVTTTTTATATAGVRTDISAPAPTTAPGTLNLSSTSVEVSLAALSSLSNIFPPEPDYLELHNPRSNYNTSSSSSTSSGCCGGHGSSSSSGGGGDCGDHNHGHGTHGHSAAPPSSLFGFATLSASAKAAALSRVYNFTGIAVPSPTKKSTTTPGTSPVPTINTPTTAFSIDESKSAILSLVKAALTDGSSSEEYVEAVCALVRRLVHALEVDAQTLLATSILSYVSQHQQRRRRSSEMTTDTVAVAAATAIESSVALVSMVLSTLCYVDKKSSLFATTDPTQQQLCGWCIDLALNGLTSEIESSYLVTKASQLLAVLISKLPPGEVMDNTLKRVLVTFEQLSHSNTTTTTASAVLMWIAKALFMRPDVKPLSSPTTSSTDLLGDAPFVLKLLSDTTTAPFPTTTTAAAAAAVPATATVNSWQDVFARIILNILFDMNSSSQTVAGLADAVGAQVGLIMHHHAYVLVPTYTTTFPPSSSSSTTTAAITTNNSINSGGGSAASAATVVTLPGSRGYVSPLWRQRTWTRLAQPLLNHLETLRPHPNSAPNPSNNQVQQRSSTSILSMVGAAVGITSSSSTSLATIDGTATTTAAAAAAATAADKVQLSESACLIAICGLASGVPPTIITTASPTASSVLVRAIVRALELGTAAIKAATQGDLQLPKRRVVATAAAATNRGPSASTVPVLQLNTEDQSATATLRKQSLESLEVLLEQFSDELSAYASTAIPLLVLIAQYDPISYTRASALRCLLSAKAIPYPRIHPVKPIVVRGLLHVADDKKVYVRRLAAKVRNEWLVME